MKNVVHRLNAMNPIKFLFWGLIIAHLVLVPISIIVAKTMHQ